MRPLRPILILIVTLGVAFAAGRTFLAMHEPEPIVAGPGVTERKMLSDYAPELAGTAADTPVFVLGGSAPGATMVLIGGTHPQETSGLLAAVLTVENAHVARGKLIVIPQANRSGFTYTEPLEGFPHRFEISTPHGPRWFRFGMRLSNPIHQWPDPDLYFHYPTNEPMLGSEARNLNRNFPGRQNGTYTERLANAILTLAAREKADIVLDLHEAYPEYPIINMLVAHERAFEIASLAVLNLQANGIPMSLMASPKNLHGLSHREFGDYTAAYAILAETANPLMGRFRGRTDEALGLEGKDENYVSAAKLKRLFVPFTESGHPLRGRVARHIATIKEIVDTYNEEKPDRPLDIADLPPYAQVAEDLGRFLAAPPPP